MAAADGELAAGVWECVTLAGPRELVIITVHAFVSSIFNLKVIVGSLFEWEIWSLGVLKKALLIRK